MEEIYLFKQPFALLLKYRLIWYKHAMLNNLIKFKQSIIILFGLFLPSISGLYIVCSSLLIYVLNNNATFFTHLITLIIWQSVFACWLLLQINAVRGLPFQCYVQVLPISEWIKIKLDLLMILISDLLLLIPMFLIFSKLANLAVGINFVIFILSLLSTQFILLSKRYTTVVSIIIFDIIFVLSRHVYRGEIQYYLELTQFFLLLVPFVFHNAHFNFVKSHKSLPSSKELCFSRLPIELLVLLKTSVIAFLLRLSAVSIIWIVGFIIARNAESVLIKNDAIVITIVLITFLMSSCYLIWITNRKKYSHFFKSLPRSEIKWAIREIISISILFLTLDIVFLLVVHSNDLLFSSILFILMNQVFLSILLYVIYKYFFRQCVTVAVLCSLLWASVLLYYLNGSQL